MKIAVIAAYLIVSLGSAAFGVMNLAFGGEAMKERATFLSSGISHLALLFFILPLVMTGIAAFTRKPWPNVFSLPFTGMIIVLGPVIGFCLMILSEMFGA